MGEFVNTGQFGCGTGPLMRVLQVYSEHHFEPGENGVRSLDRLGACLCKWAVA